MMYVLYRRQISLNRRTAYRIPYSPGTCPKAATISSRAWTPIFS